MRKRESLPVMQWCCKDHFLYCASYCLILRGLSHCLLFTENRAYMESYYFCEKDSLSIQVKNFSGFWDDFSKAEIVFLGMCLLTPVGFLLELKAGLVSFPFPCLSLFDKWAQRSCGEQKVAPFLLSCGLSHLCVYSNSSLLGFRAALRWELTVSLWFLTTFSLIKRQGHVQWCVLSNAGRHLPLGAQWETVAKVWQGPMRAACLLQDLLHNLLCSHRQQKTVRCVRALGKDLPLACHVYWMKLMVDWMSREWRNWMKLLFET